MAADPRDRTAGPQPLLRWPTWIGVVAEDLEAQRRFYGDVLGLAEVEAGDDYVQFDMGEGRVFEVIRRSEQPQYDAPRTQIGFQVEDIRAAREELIRRGVEPLTEIEGGPESANLWAYFRDHEGNVFEITQMLERPTTKGDR